MTDPKRKPLRAEDDPDLQELLEQRRRRREQENAYTASVFSGDLQNAVARAFGLVHVEGGPCVQSAPEGAEFVAGYPLDQESMVTWDHRVTCPDCRVAMAITNGDTAAPEPDEYAKRTVVVHSLAAFGQPFCTVSTDSPFVAPGGSPYATTASMTLQLDRVTCAECRKKLREGGYIR